MKVRNCESMHFISWCDEISSRADLKKRYRVESSERSAFSDVYAWEKHRLFADRFLNAHLQSPLICMYAFVCIMCIARCESDRVMRSFAAPASTFDDMINDNALITLVSRPQHFKCLPHVFFSHWIPKCNHNFYIAFSLHMTTMMFWNVYSECLKKVIWKFFVKLCYLFVKMIYILYWYYLNCLLLGCDTSKQVGHEYR